MNENSTNDNKDLLLENIIQSTKNKLEDNQTVVDKSGFVSSINDEKEKKVSNNNRLGKNNVLSKTILHS